ncbi:MAG: SMC-Scp complex subunit ScpB [Planctomycetota bacterium]
MRNSGPSASALQRDGGHPLTGGPRALGGRGVPRRSGLAIASAKSQSTGQATEDDRQAARRRRVEAVLLLAREPLTLRRLAKLANLEDATQARTLINDLSARLDRRGCAFGVVSVAGGYQLRTRSKLSPWLSAAGLDPPAQLSQPALETLVVVAARQPVVRAEVEAIRGVQCGELLRQLMDRGLLRIVGRGEELGRPLLYGTTRQFLEVFGLMGLDDLPKIGVRESA